MMCAKFTALEIHCEMMDMINKNVDLMSGAHLTLFQEKLTFKHHILYAPLGTIKDDKFLL